MSSGPEQPPEQPSEHSAQPSEQHSSPTSPEADTSATTPEETAAKPFGSPVDLALLATMLLAMVLTLISFFLPYFRQVTRPEDAETELHIKDTPWRRVYEPEIPPDQVAILGEQHPARYGIPLSFVLAILLTSLIVRVVLTQRDRPLLVEVARITAVVGGSAIAVSVFTIAMDVLARLSYNTAALSTFGGLDVRYTTDAGFWLLVAAGIAGLAACLLAIFESYIKQYREQTVSSNGTGRNSGTIDTA